jgi:hypothetical protein
VLGAIGRGEVVVHAAEALSGSEMGRGHGWT